MLHLTRLWEPSLALRIDDRAAMSPSEPLARSRVSQLVEELSHSDDLRPVDGATP